MLQQKVLFSDCLMSSLWTVSLFRVCQNIRMHLSRLFQASNFIGFNACRKEFFRGMKVHALVTTHGRPWIVWMTPGNVHDNRAYKEKSALDGLAARKQNLRRQCLLGRSSGNFAGTAWTTADRSPEGKYNPTSACERFSGSTRNQEGRRDDF